MTNEELNTKLYEKLYAEQEDFKGWLLKQPPEEILKHAYEYVIREDIVIEMEFHDLTDDKARALLADEKPLQSIYNIYEDLEGGHMDEIRDCIESRAKTCIEEQREALRNLPVYVFSATFAKEHGELEAYRASFRANVDCKSAIEESISNHYSDNRLDGSCVQEVVDRFGAERVSFVLANTIQHKDWDGRISPENKEWAKAELVPNDFDAWGGKKTIGTEFIIVSISDCAIANSSLAPPFVTSPAIIPKSKFCFSIHFQAYLRLPAVFPLGSFVICKSDMAKNEHMGFALLEPFIYSPPDESLMVLYLQWHEQKERPSSQILIYPPWRLQSDCGRFYISNRSVERNLVYERKLELSPW